MKNQEPNREEKNKTAQRIPKEIKRNVRPNWNH